MQAALSTSSTYAMRDDTGKAQYEHRVRTLLDAAGPVIWREALSDQETQVHDTIGGIGLVGREMCDECDAFLGKPHREGCSKRPGIVQKGEAVEKFTSVDHADKEDPLIGLDTDTVELLLRNLNMAAGKDFERLKAVGEGFKAFLDAAQEVESP